MQRRNIRAISPIIATILLIVITIAGALIVWSMLGSFTGKSNVSGVSIVAASANLQPDGQTLVLKVSVKNTGTTLLTGNVTAKVGDVTYYLLTNGTPTTNTPATKISLSGGAVVELTVTVQSNPPPSSVLFTAKFSDPSGKIVQDFEGVSVSSA
jgi:flagellin-like protein